MNSGFSWRVLLIGAVIFSIGIAVLLILVELFGHGGTSDSVAVNGPRFF